MPFPWRLRWPWNSFPGQSGRHLDDPVVPPHQVILTHKYVVAVIAFLVSVDLIEIVGVLCYQLFTASYFPWHLYPMMLNRAVELIALICSRGHIPNLYSVIQIILSLLSIAVYAKRQPCAKYSCAAPLILYSILLSYQIFVAIMVFKVSRMTMADDDGHIIANWPRRQSTSAESEEHARSLGIQIVSLSRRGGFLRESDGEAFRDKSPDYPEIIFAVQQPDGEKFAIAKPCRDIGWETAIDIDTSEFSYSDMGEETKEHAVASEGTEGLPSTPQSVDISDATRDQPNNLEHANKLPEAESQVKLPEAES